MHGTKWAALAAGAVLLLAGCGGGDGDTGPTGTAGTASAGSPERDLDAGDGAEVGPLTREDAQREIDAAAKAAGLPDDGRPRGAVPSAPAGASTSEKVKYRALACTALWTWLGPGAKLADPAGSYDKTVAELTKNGWQDGARSEQEAEPGSTSVQTVLTKSGWTLYARHHGSKALTMLSFNATEDACMKQFTPKEQEQLLGDAAATAGQGG
ncbi:hypothetical protein [Streptomyces sp. NPDC097619]|uniref:hypothetical protein n=1 Tax=Streptomyces sp. NPDC097619 TaxID=3157228 RepID=UPI003326ACB4